MIHYGIQKPILFINTYIPYTAYSLLKENTWQPLDCIFQDLFLPYSWEKGIFKTILTEKKKILLQKTLHKILLIN